jgi:hypothetical protein
MEPELDTTTETTLTHEIARTLILSAAATAGMVVGVLALSAASTKIGAIRANRKAKKAAQTEE